MVISIHMLQWLLHYICYNGYCSLYTTIGIASYMLQLLLHYICCNLHWLLHIGVYRLTVYMPGWYQAKRSDPAAGCRHAGRAHVR